MTEQDVIIEDAVELGRLVTLAEVKEMLEKGQIARGAANIDLTYEQKIALEHARRFARLDAKTSHKLVKALVDALPGVEEKYAVRVADLLPQHDDDVRALFQRSRRDLTDDDVAKVMAIVDAHYTA